MQQYKVKNASGHIPMIEHKEYQIYGGNHLIFIYLAKADSRISNTLLNTSEDPDFDQRVKGAIGWYLAKLMTQC